MTVRCDTIVPKGIPGNCLVFVKKDGCGEKRDLNVDF